MSRVKVELDYSNIFESVEFPDAYKVSYLANAIVFPTYEDVRKDFGLVRAEYHLLLCLAHYSELTAQDVARITRRPRNSISRAVHRMLDLGFFPFHSNILQSMFISFNNFLTFLASFEESFLSL